MLHIYIYIYDISSLRVKPDGCVRFVQFPFVVLLSVYIYGLFGVYKFDIRVPVHRR